jgi:hypothetical protein
MGEVSIIAILTQLRQPATATARAAGRRLDGDALALNVVGNPIGGSGWPFVTDIRIKH